MRDAIPIEVSQQENGTWLLNCTGCGVRITAWDEDEAEQLSRFHEKYHEVMRLHPAVTVVRPGGMLARLRRLSRLVHR